MVIFIFVSGFCWFLVLDYLCYPFSVCFFNNIHAHISGSFGIVLLSRSLKNLTSTFKDIYYAFLFVDNLPFVSYSAKGYRHSNRFCVSKMSQQAGGSFGRHFHVLIFVLLSRTNRGGPAPQPHRRRVITAGTGKHNDYLLTVYKVVHSMVTCFLPCLLNDWTLIRKLSSFPFCCAAPAFGTAEDHDGGTLEALLHPPHGSLQTLVGWRTSLHCLYVLFVLFLFCAHKHWCPPPSLFPVKISWTHATPLL